MKTRSLIVLLAGLALAQFAHAYDHDLRERESGARKLPMAVIVRFTSQGDGIDSHGYKKVLKLVTRQLGSGDMNKLLQRQWGREGERTLCLQFTSWEGAREQESKLAALIAPGNEGRAHPRTGLRADQFCDNSSLEHF